MRHWFNPLALIAAMPRHPMKWGVLLLPLAAVSRCVLAERDRWALWTPVFFGLGIALYFQLGREPPLVVLFATMGGLLILWLVLVRVCNVLVSGSLLILVLAVAGCTLVAWTTAHVAAPVVERDVAVWGLSGQVTRVEVFPNGPRVRLEHLDMGSRAGRGEGVPHSVRVKLQRGEAPVAGAWISLNARLSPPPRPSFPGAYDFARAAWFDSLGGVGFALSPWEVTDPRVSTGPVEQFWIFVGSVRLAISNRIRSALPGREGAIMAALLTGDRAGVPEAELEALRRAGLAHLLAISGLHIGMVVFLVFATIRTGLASIEPLARDWPIKKWAAGVAFLAGLIYLFLAGATVPTQRAFMMTGFVLLAVLTDRQAISMRLVGVAAGIVLLISPDSLVGASFQLSFAAVIALVAVYESYRIGGDENPRERTHFGKLRFYLSAVALTTVIAGAATAPFALYHFGRIAHYGLLANLLAIPVVTFWIMPLGLLSLLFLPLGGEAYPLLLAGYGVDFVLTLAQWVSDLPGAVSDLPRMPVWGLALIATGGLWAAIWRKTWRVLGAMPVLAGVLSPYFLPSPIAILHDTGSQAAIVWDGALWVERDRRNRFALGVWAEKTAFQIGGDWQDLAAMPDGPMSCDPLGCSVTLLQVGQREAVSMSFPTDPRAVWEDCRRSDLARLPVQPHPATCLNTVALGPADLKRDGAHAVYWSEMDGLTIETVEERRGVRPWTGGGSQP